MGMNQEVLSLIMERLHMLFILQSLNSMNLPKQSLFRIKNFYSTEIVGIVNSKNDKVLIELTHIENETKKTTKLKLTINELTKASR